MHKNSFLGSYSTPDVANCRQKGYGNSPHTPDLGDKKRFSIFAYPKKQAL